MDVRYGEELRWLMAEIARMKGRMTQLNDQQRNWGIALAEQRQRNVELKENLARAEKELAKAKEEAQREAAKQQMEQENAEHEVAEKKAELEKCRLESKQLSRQLEETKRQVAPVLDEIGALNLAIGQLQRDVETKRNALEKSEMLPNEVKSYQARLARAMALKPGLLQKASFAKDLVTELGEPGNSERSRLLAQYKRLAESLQPMEYKQPGD